MKKITLPDFKETLARIKLPRIRRLNKWTILAMLSYLNVLVFIPILLSKKNDFVKYHAKQGLILLLFTTIAIFSFYIPVLPWILALYILVCILFGLWNVFTSREKALPILGKYFN